MEKKTNRDERKYNLTEREKMFKAMFAEYFKDDIRCRDCGRILTDEEINQIDDQCFSCYEDAWEEAAETDAFLNKLQHYGLSNNGYDDNLKTKERRSNEKNYG